jgi:hypothetical protein
VANPSTTFTLLEARLHELFADSEIESTNASVQRYFTEGFTGSRFEVLADRDPYRITGNDIVAVSTLGVAVPAHVAIWLLGEGRRTVAELLREIPVDVDIWDSGDALEPGGAAWQLWDVLLGCGWPGPRTGNGMGGTITSKLMAAKRPRMIPVRDSVVRQILPSTGQVWADLRNALGDEALRSRIEHATGRAPAHVSLLRRLDVALWMRGRTL